MVQHRLDLKQLQTQTLAMTPQLQQSIKMLQLSLADIQSLIAEQLENNPLLEASDSSLLDGDESHSPEMLALGEPVEAPASTNADISDITGERGLGEYDSMLDENYAGMWEGEGAVSSAVYQSENQAYIQGARSGRADFEDKDFNFENTTSEEITLQEHILSQIQMDITDPADRLIAVHLTGLIDDSGYFTEDLSAIAQNLKCSLREVETVLLMLQECEPVGVFARTLSECLMLQLRDRNHLDPAILKILDRLDLVATQDIKQLQSISGLNEEDIRDVFRELKSLNPRPGSLFTHERVETIQPDVFLRKTTHGKWSVELNSDALPKLLLNRRYYKEVSNHTHTDAEKRYISDQWNHASWLIKALDQRAQTILKVASEIVAQQQEFLSQGIRHLKPLVLSDIAQAVGVHESTVSRVTHNKYMATPMGLYELKYFFSSSLSCANGENDISSRSVQHMIQELVDKEVDRSDNIKKIKILSDDDIAGILKSRGIDVARRTVAKYREALGIPSSVERRRIKRLNA
ncbi:MAG: rpoN [Rickettsiales bacterium]|jgi:RNA polymerase sigma-54 factor|nr:rpoN [Rickettsiales bacterium]